MSEIICTSVGSFYGLHLVLLCFAQLTKRLNGLASAMAVHLHEGRRTSHCLVSLLCSFLRQGIAAGAACVDARLQVA